jgi:hypothetical protein
MKVWPFGVALRGVASNRLMLRWLKTVVVSDEEKASDETSGGDREGERKRIAIEVSKLVIVDIGTGACTRSQDKSGGGPDYWPGGVRHVGDASPVCGFHVERGKAGPDTVSAVGMVGARGSVSSG